MDSMVMRSPPTSAPNAARSCVAVITLILPAACAELIEATSTAATTRQFVILEVFTSTSFGRALERMCAMCPDRKDELEQKLVSGQIVAVARTAELAADLAEFTRPIGEQERSAGIPEDRKISRPRR